MAPGVWRSCSKAAGEVRVRTQSTQSMLRLLSLSHHSRFVSISTWESTDILPARETRGREGHLFCLWERKGQGYFGDFMETRPD